MISREDNTALFFKEIVDKFKRLIEVALNNTLVGTKTRINFKDSDTIRWVIKDNPDNKSIDISAEVI